MLRIPTHRSNSEFALVLATPRQQRHRIRQRVARLQPTSAPRLLPGAQAGRCTLRTSFIARWPPPQPFRSIRGLLRCSTSTEACQPTKDTVTHINDGSTVGTGRLRRWISHFHINAFSLRIQNLKLRSFLFREGDERPR